MQDWLNVTFEYARFVNHCRIEHNISTFLIWEDVLVLAPAHARPAVDSVFGAIAAVAVVTNNSADKARVSGWYAIVVVERKCGERRHINAEFQTIIDV